jgi:hypothetical protein
MVGSSVLEPRDAPCGKVSGRCRKRRAGNTTTSEQFVGRNILAPAKSVRKAGAALSEREQMPRMTIPDFVFAFHDEDEIGPAMLARIARYTGLTADDL